MTNKRRLTYDVMYYAVASNLHLKINSATLIVIWEATTCSIGIMADAATDSATGDMMKEVAK